MRESASGTCGSSIRFFRPWKRFDSTVLDIAWSARGAQKPSCSANPSKPCRFGLPICGRHKRRNARYLPGYCSTKGNRGIEVRVA